MADELNLYADAALVNETRRAIRDSGRDVALSVFLSWEWDKWPTDPWSELDRWADLGVDRACVSVAGPDMGKRVEMLATRPSGESGLA